MIMLNVSYFKSLAKLCFFRDVKAMHRYFFALSIFRGNEKGMLLHKIL